MVPVFSVAFSSLDATCTSTVLSRNDLKYIQYQVSVQVEILYNKFATRTPGHSDQTPELSPRADAWRLRASDPRTRARSHRSHILWIQYMYNVQRISAFVSIGIVASSPGDSISIATL